MALISDWRDTLDYLLWRVALAPSPSFLFPLQPSSGAQSNLSPLNCTRDAFDKSEWCACALQDTPARLHHRFEKVCVHIRSILMLQQQLCSVASRSFSKKT